MNIMNIKPSWNIIYSKIIAMLILSLVTNIILAQTTVNYSESNAIISNPERGLQKYSITNNCLVAINVYRYQFAEPEFYPFTLREYHHSASIIW